MEDRQLHINAYLRIPVDEIEWRFSGSGGPGGQHANTANTRVEALFNIATSSSLSDYQRARLLERYGEVLRVVVSDERSQLRNRERALERMATRVREALYVPRPRRPTKPSRGSVERRLEAKKNQSRKKQERTRWSDNT